MRCKICFIYISRGCWEQIYMIGISFLHVCYVCLCGLLFFDSEGVMGYLPFVKFHCYSFCLWWISIWSWFYHNGDAVELYLNFVFQMHSFFFISHSFGCWIFILHWFIWIRRLLFIFCRHFNCTFCCNTKQNYNEERNWKWFIVYWHVHDFLIKNKTIMGQIDKRA